MKKQLTRTRKSSVLGWIADKLSKLSTAIRTTSYLIVGNTTATLEDGDAAILGNLSVGEIARVRELIADNVDGSPTILTGGEVSAGTNAGTFKIGDLTALLRTTDSLLGELTKVTLDEQDNQAITLADTEYVVALNYNAGNPTISIDTTNPYNADKRNIPIGRVMKEADNTVHYLSGGFDLQDGVRKLHMRARTLRSLELASGCAIAYQAVREFTIEAGIVYGGINKITISAFDSAVGKFTAVYQDGGVGWTYVADQTVIDHDHYDDGDGGLAQTSVNRYSNHWIYMHPTDGHVYSVYGRGNFKLAEAEAELAPTIPSPLMDVFGLLLGRITVERNGTSYIIAMVSDTFFTGTATADHGALGGLADDDHEQYLLEDGTRALTGNLAVDAGITIDGIDIGVAVPLNTTHRGSDGSDHSLVTAHKDRHDPEDGADPLDCAAPAEISGVQIAFEGTAHTFARSDHQHQIVHSIVDNHLVAMDDADAAANDYTRLTASGLEGRSYSEVRDDLEVLKFVPLTTKLSSTAWDGDAYSTTGKTKIDLSVVFGAPAGIKAVLLRLSIRDSGSVDGAAWFMVSPNDGAYDTAGSVGIQGVPNDIWRDLSVTCPCDANGDIYYQCGSTGTSTLDVYMQIWGYWT